MWMLRQSVADGQGKAEDQVGCIEPENWMNRSWVDAVEVVVVVGYADEPETVGSVGWIFCGMGTVEVPVVKWMAESIGQTKAEYMS